MVIEINKDIDRYKESVVMGLTAKQLIFSVASVVAGGSIVLLLYRYIGLTPSVYVAIPVVAPIALGGFYSFNGMSFYEVMGRKMRMLFANHPLTYVSTEGEAVIKECRQEEAAKTVEGGSGRLDAVRIPDSRAALHHSFPLYPHVRRDLRLPGIQPGAGAGGMGGAGNLP